jgi:hypothetical protein
MSSTDVTTVSPVGISNPGDPVVVLASDDIETIVVNEQGPPGPPGPPGSMGLEGPQGFPGNTVLYGAVDPVASDGVDGNFYINTTTHFMFGPKANHAWPAGTSLIGPQGPQGIQGVQGVQGIPGNTVLYGAGAPASGVGVDGNFYINTSTNFIYGPKTADAWPAGTSMVGPQGPQGIQGIPGNTVLYSAGPPASGTGVDGNFYIDTTAHVIYGPKAAGAWPAGTSLVGPQGPQGVQGIQGPVGPTGPVPEAPTDGQIYGRQNSAWTPASGFPAGTVMLFYQAAAPTGWTKLTTQNDKTLRVVSGSGGVAGGTNAFSTVQAQSVVGNHTLATSEISAGLTSSGNNSITVYPNGNSGNYVPFGTAAWYASPTVQSGTYYVAYTSNNALSYYTNGSGNNPISVTGGGGGSAHNHPITMDIQYIDVILASKN